jgi:UDP-glucose 4-epimerase
LRDLNYAVLRFSNPFGERQNPLISQGLITHLLYRIKKKKTIEIWGDGNVIRDYFYIKDGTKAVCLSLFDRSGVSTFNISSGTGFSINQILHKFKNVLGLDFKVEYQQARKFDVQSNVLDNSLAAKILGWKPETNFDDALIKTWSYVVDYK